MWSIEQGELIIKITGDIGVGKTLVTRKVVEALKEQKYTIPTLKTLTYRLKAFIDAF